MKHSMEQNEIEFQNVHLWDINSLKWEFSMQTFISTLVTWQPFSFMIKMGMERGFYTMNGCLNENTRRIKNANRKDTESVKVRRHLLRGKRKCKSDKSKKQEGSVYGYGIFFNVLGLCFCFRSVFLFYSCVDCLFCMHNTRIFLSKL